MVITDYHNYDDDNQRLNRRSEEIQIMKNTSPNTNSNDDHQHHDHHHHQQQQQSDEFETKPPPRLYLLYGIIILQLVIFLAEMIIDQMVHSLLIMADAYHHLFNTFNAILLVVCYKISNQMSVKNTFGWVRMELLGMLTTITFIVALIFSLLIEGALQIFHLHEISGPTNTKILIIFGVWSLLVNILYILTINGVMTDKKYKQTTQQERSFSTAKCLRRQSGGSGGVAGDDGDDSISISSKRLEKIPFPRNRIESFDSTSLQPITTLADNQINDDNNKPKLQRLATMDPTSLLNEDYRIEFLSKSQLSLKNLSSSNHNHQNNINNNDQQIDNFCQSFIQGILSPCFVIFCGCLITSIKYGNDNGYWSMEMVEIIDPLIGIITAISLCITFYPQLKNTFLILMQTIPEGVNIVQLKKDLLDRYETIENIHEFHLWLLNSSNIVITCHIVLQSENRHKYRHLFDDIKHYLQYKYGIRHITIQPEFTTTTTLSSNDNNNHHYHNYNNNQQRREKYRYSFDQCINQCLVKCPCDRDGDCEQCLLKSCCINNKDLRQHRTSLKTADINIDRIIVDK